MWLLPCILAVIVVLLTLVYRRRQRKYEFFKKMGIPGPQPHWLFGNIKTFEEKNMYVAFQDWTKQYGKYYGIYKGPDPVLVTSDMDILQEVFITQFSKFHSREIFCISPDPDDASDVDMFTARGKRWKRMRSICVPTFSTSKMKQMTPIMQKCVGILVDNFEKAAASGAPIDVYRLYKGLTLQVIAECGMGWAVESQTNSQDPFLLNCQKLFDMSDTKDKMLIIRVAEVFPWLRSFWWEFFKFLSNFVMDPNTWLINNMTRIIEMRKTDSMDTKHKDLLQLMIDAESDSALADEQASLTMTDDAADAADAADDVANSSLPTEPDSTKGEHFKKALTTKEMQMTLFIFLIAGFETTSTALAFCSHLLALHPDIQERVQQEIDNITGSESDEDVTFDQLQKMTYLHSVILETLRLYPIATVAQARLCMEDTTVKGIDVPKGLLVAGDIWSIHYDPNIWPDPEKFDPDRFSPENVKGRHPLAWIPFGAGPRNCVGMRFGLLEAKMAMASILRKYTLKRCEKTEVPLVLREAPTVTPKNGVYVTLVERH